MEGILRDAVRNFFKGRYPALAIYNMQLAEVPQPVFPAIFFTLGNLRILNKVFTCFCRCWILTNGDITKIEEYQKRFLEVEGERFEYCSGGSKLVFSMVPSIEIERVDLDGIRGWLFGFNVRGVLIK